MALAGDYYATYDEMHDRSGKPEGRAELAYARWHCLKLEKQGVPAPPLDPPQRKAVTDRYFKLAGQNFSHFSAGGTAWSAYIHWHSKAIIADALEVGRTSNKAVWQRALTKEAFGDHFLTDMFAAGHVRTPRVAIHGLVPAAYVRDARQVRGATWPDSCTIVFANASGSRPSPGSWSGWRGW